SCWWYAGSFSQRPVVQSYPALMLGLAACISFIFERKYFLKITAIAAGAFFLLLNLFQSWQINNGILDAYRMTPAYYVASFGKTYIPANAEKLLLVGRSFEGAQDFTDTIGYVGKQVYLQQKEQCITTSEFSDKISIPFNKITENDHAWLIIEGEFRAGDSVSKILPSIIRTFLNSRGEAYAYTGADLEITNPDMEINTWVKFRYAYLTPEVRNVNDVFLFHLWRRGAKGKICIRNVRIRAFERMPVTRENH
ncbi:MAG: hypothetical protein ACHQF2_12385, partial [Flavobacteriales bacterium]